MMAPDPRDIQAALTERQQADRVLDRWGSLRGSYTEWHREVQDVRSVYLGDWDVVWPDNVRSRALPKIPNFVQLAADDRSRAITATSPSLVCRPRKNTDKAKAQADKMERIIGGWLDCNRVQRLKVPMWAHDAMGAGLTVCRVMPDFATPAAERFPVIDRLDPMFSYPDPIFADGPTLDNFIYAREEKVRTVEKRYGVSLLGKKGWSAAQGDVCTVIEFYDDEWLVIMVESSAKASGSGQRRAAEVLVQRRHDIGTCPVVIGRRPTMTGRYAGEFFGGLGVMNYTNRLMTLMLDDAVNKVYAGKTYYNIENPEDWGPDALLEKQTADASFDYISPPNQPFSNLQIVRDLINSSRAAVLMPPSRSGDPNESIISAAGISASQSQFVEDVKSIQRDILAPMLEAAISVGLAIDEQDTGVSKSIFGEDRSGSYEETYSSKDIDGYRKVHVLYGMGAGLDEINTNVMVLQQWAGGDGLMSGRTAREQSPMIEDPQREEKQLALEQLDRAVFAGMVAQAQQGQLSAQALADIRRAVESDEVSLHDAISAFAEQAPLAAPQGQAQATGAPPEAPGVAGAAEGRGVPSNLPSMAELLGGA